MVWLFDDDLVNIFNENELILILEQYYYNIDVCNVDGVIILLKTYKYNNHVLYMSDIYSFANKCVSSNTVIFKSITHNGDDTIFEIINLNTYNFIVTFHETGSCEINNVILYEHDIKKIFILLFKRYCELTKIRNDNMLKSLELYKEC